MAVSDITFQNLTDSGSTYQPAGSTVYKMLWVGIGGQTSNALMVTNGDKEVLLWKNDGSVSQYSGIWLGSEKSEQTPTAQQANPYINSTWYLKLESACSGNNTCLFMLMEMVA